MKKNNFKVAFYITLGLSCLFSFNVKSQTCHPDLSEPLKPFPLVTSILTYAELKKNTSVKNGVEVFNLSKEEIACLSQTTTSDKLSFIVGSSSKDDYAHLIPIVKLVTDAGGQAF